MGFMIHFCQSWFINQKISTTFKR